jgi:APA family basic amino acid/polyamine antiporter
MIGVGVFTTAGFQAADLADPFTMILTWFVGGVLALCGAAVYAELATMMPNVGGDYVYLRTAFHPAFGFASGWVSLTAGFSAPIAAASLAFAQYLAHVFPNSELDPRWIAVALIVSTALLHGYDAVVGGRVQAAFTICKIAIRLGLLLQGFPSEKEAGHTSRIHV